MSGYSIVRTSAADDDGIIIDKFQDDRVMRNVSRCSNERIRSVYELRARQREIVPVWRVHDGPVLNSRPSLPILLSMPRDM